MLFYLKLPLQKYDLKGLSKVTENSKKGLAHLQWPIFLCYSLQLIWYPMGNNVYKHLLSGRNECK